MLPTRNHKFLATGLVLLLWLLLACVCTAPSGYQSVTTTVLSRGHPAWACPSDTPLPYEASGPLRSPGCCCEEVCDTNPVTGEEDCDCVDDTSCYECRYYQWEQENGALGGPPFPAPTEYTIEDDVQFRMAHRVNFPGQVDVQVETTHLGDYEPAIDGTWTEVSDVTEATQSLQLVTVTFDSHNPTAFPFAPFRQVVVSGVNAAEGGQLAGEWRWSRDASDVAGIGEVEPPPPPPSPTAILDPIPIETMLAGGEHTHSGGATPVPVSTIVDTQIASGTTTIEIPVFTPPGTVRVVDFHLDPPGAAMDRGEAGEFRVSFIDEDEPYCSHDGIPHWSGAQGGKAVMEGASSAAAMYAGENAVVQKALEAVGHQYCWGGKGYVPCDGGGVTPSCYGDQLPCWDCAGLTAWAWTESGVPVQPGTANQKNLPAVSRAEVRPGDILLFCCPNHAGLFAGDLDGDGTGDMIQAGCPNAYGPGEGIGIEKDVFNNPYWMQKQPLQSIRRPSTE
jgi:cell wall-associated NlpC family hydrolase